MRSCIEPITQIVAGVGFLLAGVLNLVGNLLSGLGLDSLLRGICSAIVSLHKLILVILLFTYDNICRASRRYFVVWVSKSYMYNYQCKSRLGYRVSYCISFK